MLNEVQYLYPSKKGMIQKCWKLLMQVNIYRSIEIIFTETLTSKNSILAHLRKHDG